MQLLLVEHLRHETEVAQRREPALLGDRDAGRLLAPVLEREQAEGGQPCDIALACIDAEDSAHAYVPPPISTKPRVPSSASCSGGIPSTAAPLSGSPGRSTSAGRPLQRAASA